MIDSITDAIIMDDIDEYRWAEGRHSGGGAGGVVGFGIAASPETGTHHGVYVLDDRGEVKDILQKASLAELKKQGAIRSVHHPSSVTCVCAHYLMRSYRMVPYC